MPGPTPQPDDRLLDAIESMADSAQAPAAQGHSPEELRQIAAMRRQRASLIKLGQRIQQRAPSPTATDSAMDRLAVSLQLDLVAQEVEAQSAPQPLPISAFRIERRPLWQRAMQTKWPMRLSAAASIALVGYAGIVGLKAASDRYAAWEQQQLASRQAGTPDTANPQPLTAPGASTTAIATSTPPTNPVLPEAGTTPQQPITVASLPPTQTELARAGQLVILVRAKSPSRMNTTVSGLARRASEVIAAAPADAAWQSRVLASTTAALAEQPGSAGMAGFISQLTLGQPTLISYGPMAQSAVPMIASANAAPLAAPHTGPSSAAPAPDLQSQLADWFASRTATTHVLTVRDQPAAIERLTRRLAGSRGVTVEIVRLDAPLPEATLSSYPLAAPAPATAAPAPAAAPGAGNTAMDNLLWWTRPASQWQRLEIPVIVIEQ